ncbi:replication initiation protein [Cerasicoccus frondis]|uniref:replication initiation protein n=1 Tax=Cerasicoccus frondis TaxID=490090 RepID=UPI0028524E61|nr:replication initiation protein [Cerasicoccus frondis]
MSEVAVKIAKKKAAVPLPEGLIDRGMVAMANEFAIAPTQITLAEKRIFNMLVAAVHPEDDDFKVYRVGIKEIADLAGLKGHHVHQQTWEVTKRFMSRVLELGRDANGNLRKNPKLVNYVSMAEPSDDGSSILIQINPHLKPYFLALKSGFVRFPLRNIVPLRSVYSQRMYEILKSYQYQNRKIEITLDEFREIFKLGNKKYKLYADFKKRILKASQEDLKSTDIGFKFTEKKKGRRVHSIVFEIFENQPSDQLDFGLPVVNDNQDRIDSEERLIEDILAAGYTRDPTKIIIRDGLELTRASLDVALEEMNRSGFEVKNPGGFIAKKLDERAGLARLIQRDRHEAEKTARAQLKAKMDAEKVSQNVQDVVGVLKGLLQREQRNTAVFLAEGMEPATEIELRQFLEKNTQDLHLSRYDLRQTWIDEVKGDDPLAKYRLMGLREDFFMDRFPETFQPLTYRSVAVSNLDSFSPNQRKYVEKALEWLENEENREL